MPAIKYTKTAVDTTDAWDSSKAVAAIPNTAKASMLVQEYAWVDPEADADTKSAYKFPHHFVDDKGDVGDASSKACSAGIAVLNGGRGGANIPDADRKAVYNHLAAHLKDAKLEAPKLNAFDDDSKHKTTFSLDENSFVADDTSGIIHFPMGQVVSDETIQRSGTHYDIPTMDTSEFNGSVTADHIDMLQSIVAKTNLVKRGGQIVMNALQFAVKENPFAQVAYNLYKNGYAKDFSIETYGPPPDETGLMVNSKLVGLSCVVTGNNKSATVNSLVVNSLATARKNGLDTSEAEKAFGIEPEALTPKEAKESLSNNKETEMKFVTLENGRDFAIEVSYKNAAGTDITQELAPGATLDVSEDQKEALEKVIAQAKQPADETNLEAFNTAMNTALEAQDKKFQERFDAMTKNMLDANAKEPEFKAGKGKETNGLKDVDKELESMNWRDRTALQIESIGTMIKDHDPEAAARVRAINKLHLEQLKASGKANNALSLGNLGNFVIAPEMDTEISGNINDYTPILNQFKFQETLSLQTSWLERTGEINMTDTNMSDAGDNTDLKAISKPSYTTHTSTLYEFAAVTPVDASAIRFSAADIMEDISSMYSRAYNRALATSVIGRLELAVEANGNSVNYDFTSGNGGNVGALAAFVRVWADVAAYVPNGVYIMTMASYLSLFEMSLRAGISGPLANIFAAGPDGLKTFLGLPYVISPPDLLPTLNTANTKTLVFEGNTATVNHGVFLADPANFKGRVSGGLSFQVSSEASYEEGGTVKSAFQRDKLVFRGYGYRKSAITNTANVAGIAAPGIS